MILKILRQSDSELCEWINWGRGRSGPPGPPKLTFEFLSHFWPNFQTFCVLGTQNFEPDLIVTFADGLVEVEVTRGGEVVPNWPLSFSAISGLFFKLFASLALRKSRPVLFWPLRTDWSRLRQLGSARSSLTDLWISRPFLGLFNIFCVLGTQNFETNLIGRGCEDFNALSKANIHFTRQP